MKTDSQKKKYYCHITGEEIPELRAQALLEMGVPEDRMTCIKVAEKTIKKRKGLYTGLPGVSELLVVDKIYNDSVHQMFHRADSDDEMEEKTAETEKVSAYVKISKENDENE